MRPKGGEKRNRMVSESLSEVTFKLRLAEQGRHGCGKNASGREENASKDLREEATQDLRGNDEQSLRGGGHVRGG